MWLNGPFKISCFGISAKSKFTSVNFINLCSVNEPTEVSTYCSATYRPVSDTVQKKEGIQSTPFEAMLEPPVLLACLASVIIHSKNSILLLLYNIASKTHPWYPIFLGKYLHSLVLQQRHESSAVGHVRFDILRLLDPYSQFFLLL